jgi:hypothetical protein
VVEVEAEMYLEQEALVGEVREQQVVLAHRELPILEVEAAELFQLPHQATVAQAL